MKLKTKDPIPSEIKRIYYSLLRPVVRISLQLNVHPNTYTTCGFLLACFAGVFAAVGNLRLSALFILFSGMLDTIDGALARESGKVTRFGALYDSTLDRFSEVIYFFGLAFYFVNVHDLASSLAVAISLGGSLLVSYVRAKAESLQFECNVGLLQRPERILLLGIGGLISEITLIIALWIIALLSNVTAVHRILHVWKQDKNILEKDQRKDV